MPLQKPLSFEVGVQWHFGAEELVYPAVANCHICSTRPFDYANVIDYDNAQSDSERKKKGGGQIS